MILEKQSQSVIYETGAAKESIGMSLDLDSAQVLMQMLSKNLYSDAIGSTVRECASNALDSHRRAGTDDPIIVRFRQVSGTSNYEFSVEDFGIGLDDKDVEEIISKYGKSTKRNSTTELGMMGLGFKAPLAYCSSFYFVARKDGMERKYMMYEGDETNTIDLLYEKETTERNGVKVIIPVVYRDNYEFHKKIKEQLAYFQNVYFDVEDIKNDFSIYRGEHYQISQLTTATNMHICLDDVYYPIDWSKIDMLAIKVPVGLKFSLTDGLFPTPNRESIRYTVEAKDKIKAKIQAVADEMIDIYNDSIEEDCTFDHVLEYYYSNSVNIPHPTGNGWLDIADLAKRGTKAIMTPKMKDIKLLDLKELYQRREYILNEYDRKFELEKGWNRKTMRSYKDRWGTQMGVNAGRSFTDRNIYIFDDIFGERKKRYVKETFSKGAEFVKKMRTFTLLTMFTDSNGRRKPDPSNMMTYYGLLRLEYYPKSQWRQRIKEFQSIRDYYVNQFKNLDDVIVPESWILQDKASRKTVKTVNGGINIKENKNKGDIAGKIPLKMERWSAEFNCTFTNHIWKGDSLHKTGKLVIYGKAEDRKLLDKWYVLVNNKYAQIAMLSDKEIKTVESYGLHNWMSVHEFIKGKNKVYRRTVSMLAIRQLKDLYQTVFNKKMDKCCIRGLYTDVNILNKYLNKYEPNNPRNNGVSHDELSEDIAAGNVDTNIIDVYNRTKALLEKFHWIKTIFDDYGYYKQSSYTSMMEQLCRYNHVHMEKDEYKLSEGWQPVDEIGQFQLFVA